MKFSLDRLIGYCKVVIDNLRYSLISVNYYKDVFNIYKGYGIKYIFLISWLSAMIYSANILWNINKFQDALLGQDSYIIDNIIKQIPTIEYNNGSIEISAEEPFYIYDGARKIAAIDTKGEMTAAERRSVPIIFRKNNMAINLANNYIENGESTVIDYSRFFGKINQTLTGVDIKNSVTKNLEDFGKLFIYIAMPLIGLGRFLEVLLRKGFSILITLIVGYGLGLKMNFKKSCRLVMYASAISVLLQPFAMIESTITTIILLLLQIVPGALMMVALIRLSGQKKILL